MLLLFPLYQVKQRYKPKLQGCLLIILLTCSLILTLFTGMQPLQIILQFHPYTTLNARQLAGLVNLQMPIKC